ncbi:hypothetical protein I4U23_019086 [Adineta vaga]|nr:hypothetical protein I4U23_019086 [Adineta vaga]
MEPLSWPNTVQLTLSIQQPSELKLLFQHNALPVIEQLNVINENQYIALLFHTSKSIQDNLREKSNDTIYLKCLILRYMILHGVVSLIGSLNMPLLEKLILIEMYDDTLDCIGEFQELCSSTHLPCLKNLHFSLCFPQEMEPMWQMSSFNYNRQWPFNNIDCYLDDCYIRTQKESDLIPKTLFVIYTHPINVLFRYKRTFYNYGFTTHIYTSHSYNSATIDSMDL